MLYGDFFKDVIFVNADAHPTMHIMKEEFHGALAMVSHSLHSPVLYLATAGVLSAWLLYVKLPHLPAKIAQAFRPVYVLFENKYYLDALYFNVFAKGTRALGNFFWKVGDTAIIDNGIVNGSPNWSAQLPRKCVKSKPALSTPTPPLWCSAYWYCSA